MSNSEGKPPRSSEDRDGKFVNFTEEFRKSKRASLSWSALTLFVALAPNWGNGQRILGMTIPYPQATFALLLCIAATFYFAAFVRHLEIVTVQNSEAARDAEQAWSSLRAVLEGWQQKLAPLSMKLNGVDAMLDVLESRKNAGDAVFDQTLKLWENRESEGDYQRERILDVFSNNATADTATDTLKKWHDLDTSFGKTLREKIPALKIDYRMKVDALAVERNDIASQLTGLEKTIGSLQSALADFRDAIGPREKRWHFWHDRVPVVAMFGLALITTAGCFGDTYPTIASAIADLRM